MGVGVEATATPPLMAYSEVMRRPAGGRRAERRGSGRGHPGCGGPELVGGVVKARWWVSRREPTNRDSMWPYIPPRFPLPRHLYTEEMDIRHQAQDAERKSRDHLRMGGYRVLKMPPLQELPMPWRLGDSEERKFWKG